MTTVVKTKGVAATTLQSTSDDGIVDSKCLV